MISVKTETLIHFLEAAQGNYRNAIYIQCNVCRFQREEGCGDFLYIPNDNCIPILLPIKDAQTYFGSIDYTDCAATLSNISFHHLYHQWLIQSTSSDNICPMHQILQLT